MPRTSTSRPRVSRGTDMSGSAGRHAERAITSTPPLTPPRSKTAAASSPSEWRRGSRRGAGRHPRRAPSTPCRPCAGPWPGPRARPCSDGLDVCDRDEVADQVLAWIDALGAGHLAPPQPPAGGAASGGAEASGPQPRSRPRLAEVLARLRDRRARHVVATLLAAGIQVPIAAGAWLLVLLAAHPHARPRPRPCWCGRRLRVAPPTWVTARVTTAPVELGRPRRCRQGRSCWSARCSWAASADLVPDDPGPRPTSDPNGGAATTSRPEPGCPSAPAHTPAPDAPSGFALLRDLADVGAASIELTLARAGHNRPEPRDPRRSPRARRLLAPPTTMTP